MRPGGRKCSQPARWSARARRPAAPSAYGPCKRHRPAARRPREPQPCAAAVWLASTPRPTRAGAELADDLPGHGGGNLGKADDVRAARPQVSVELAGPPGRQQRRIGERGQRPGRRGPGSTTVARSSGPSSRTATASGSGGRVRHPVIPAHYGHGSAAPRLPGREMRPPPLQLAPVRMVIARCSVNYAGRLSAHLALATRLIMVKADGSVLVHSDGGSYKPLNWMSPPCRLARRPAAGWSPENQARR